MATRPTTAPAQEQPLESEFFTPQRTRLFSIAGGAVLALGVVVWFFLTLSQRKERYAAVDLEKARAVAAQGNLGGAASDFQAVMDNYRGTTASYEAAIGLAQVRLIADQYEGAITTLNTFLGQNPPTEYAVPANGLLGAAYENTGKLTEAVAAYRKSADLAVVANLKVSALLDAARASRNAGKKDDAIKILKEIMEKYKDDSGATQAELMLGELTGGKG